MATTSHLHALKVALRAALMALPALEGVEVWSAEPFAGAKTRDYLALAGPDSSDVDWHMIGRVHPRAEAVTLRGYVTVRRKGAGETVIQSTRARAYALVAVVETLLVTDPSLGNVTTAALCAPTTLTEGANQGERVAMLEFEIRTGKHRLAA